MTARLEAMLVDGLTSAFDDLDVYCRVGFRPTRRRFEWSAQVGLEDLRGGQHCGFLIQIGEEGMGIIELPSRAGICIAGSMILLPKERVREMMDARELDEEGHQTLQEAANILCGSLGRHLREAHRFPYEIRLKEVLFNSKERVDSIPEVEGGWFSYKFRLENHLTAPFDGDLLLPQTLIERHYAGDALLERLRAEVQPAPEAEVPGRGHGSLSGPGITDAHSPGRAWTHEGMGTVRGSPPGFPGGSSSVDTPQFQSASGAPGGGSPHAPGSPVGWAAGRVSPAELRSLMAPGPVGSDPEPPRLQLHRSVASEVLAQALEPSSPESGLRGARILIVDDSWVARRTLARQLLQHDCQVSDARDAESARQVLERRPVDLILLDVMLPGEDGLSFCSFLRQNGVTEQVAVVIVSGLSTSHNVVQAINAGASYFLVKPVADDYLLRVLSGVLRQYRMQQMRAVVGGG